jgi:hypothetical protein
MVLDLELSGRIAGLLAMSILGVDASGETGGRGRFARSNPPGRSNHCVMIGHGQPAVHMGKRPKGQNGAVAPLPRNTTTPPASL